MNVGLLVVGAVAGVFGAAGLRLSVTAVSATVRLLAAADAPGEPGACIRFRGRAVADCDTVTAPLSGQQCLGYVLAQEQHVRVGGTPIRRWQGHVLARDLPGFAVARDGTRVRVALRSFTGEDTELVGFGRAERPGNRYSDLRLSRDEQSSHYDATDPVPDEVVGLLGLDSTAVDNAHRYVEWRLHEGEELTVAGRRTDDRTPTVGDDAAPFVLSEDGAVGAALSPLGRAGLFGAFGLLALLVAGVAVWGGL